MSKIKYKTLKFAELAQESSKRYGTTLKLFRNILLRNPEEIASVLTITVNTIKNIESGKNSHAENINELIFFYGYSLQEFYSLKQLPTWQDLFKKMKVAHSSIDSEAYKIIYKNPNLIDLIEYRLLGSVFFETWVTEKEVVQFCSNNYNYEYTQAAQTLNKAVENGWLIKDEKSKPMRWKRK